MSAIAGTRNRRRFGVTAGVVHPRDLTVEAARLMFMYEGGRLYWRTICGAKKLAGSKRPDGYRVVRVGSGSVAEHKLIWLLHYGVMPDLLDHKNGRRDDNRIENLRPASPSQNSANNRGVWGAVPYKGVAKTAAGRYQACLRARYIGLFDSAEEAARAYDLAAVAAFGDFAVTNTSLGLLHA